MEIKYFNPIILPTPKDKIYSRLGFAKGITKLDNKQRDEVEGYIEKALEIVELKGVGAILSIKKIETSKIILAEGISFVSESLAKFLVDSKEEYQEMLNFVRIVSPEHESKIQYYTGKTPIFKAFKISYSFVL